MLAQHVVDDELDYEAVVIADDEHEESIVFSRSLSDPAVSDTVPGMDGYSVTVDSGPTYYGGVEALIVVDGALEVHFSEAAADQLGVDATVIVDLERDQIEETLRALQQIIGKAATD